MRSARTFATQLADDLAAAAPRCIIRGAAPDGRSTDTCGRPAGRAEGLCPSGHARRGYVCPRHAAMQHNCSECWKQRGALVPITLLTEVA